MFVTSLSFIEYNLLHLIDDSRVDLDSWGGLNDPLDSRVPALVEQLAREVIDEVKSRSINTTQGKMFGLLVVRDLDGKVGYLRAFSGAIDGEYEVEGFVPPIFDYNDCEYYKDGESHIIEIGRQIEQIEGDEQYISAMQQLQRVESSAQQRLERARNEYVESKQLRATRRMQATAEMRSVIDRESQHQKGELRRLEAQLRAEIEEVKGEVANYTTLLETLRESRRTSSRDLQRWLYDNFTILNISQEQRSLLSIFDDNLPPTGAGECAAPKLLHYAFEMGYTPLMIGEFWIGLSPKMGEVRHEGEFYGACRGRCHPILRYMLQGAKISKQSSVVGDPKVIYEDDAIVVVDKPSGLLSVDGRGDEPSVESILRSRYSWVRAAHRLDQDTSGILVVAKSDRAHSNLQSQFARREVEKQYVAVVEGVIICDEGEITLPLRPDHLDRPRQVVDMTSGKSAVTRYEVLEWCDDGTTRLALYPHTGRTHQLRVHCAHIDGLNAPIVGDRLYGGRRAERLALHASQIIFTHPISDERITLSILPPF